jgi:hypothetical protein
MYTIAQLQQIYLEAAQSRVQNIDISNLSDFQAKSFGCAGIGGALSLDATRLFDEAVPQYASSLGVNNKLSAQGLLPQYPASPSILTVSAVGLVAGYTYILQVGTIFTASNGQNYSVIPSSYSSPTQVVITLASNIFYLSSIEDGSTTTQTNGTSLTASPAIVSTDNSQSFSAAISSACQNGTNEESLSSAAARLITVSQSPLCGTRSPDIQKECISPASGIRDTIVLTNRQLLYPGTLYTVGGFLVSGDPVTDELLNKGLVTGTTAEVFNRTTSEVLITSTQEKLVADHIIGVRPNTRTVKTYGLTDATGTAFFKVTVSLQNGYALNSNITLNGNVFTVEQLIQREVRRAICQQPFGATLESNILTGEYFSSTFLISAIEQQLDSALGSSTTTGSLGAFLVDRTVDVLSDDGVNYEHITSILLPLGIPTDPANDLEWIYDVTLSADNIYSNIEVVIT